MQQVVTYSIHVYDIEGMEWECIGEDFKDMGSAADYGNQWAEENGYGAVAFVLLPHKEAS